MEKMNLFEMQAIAGGISKNDEDMYKTKKVDIE